MPRTKSIKLTGQPGFVPDRVHVSLKPSGALIITQLGDMVLIAPDDVRKLLAFLKAEIDD